ncbi:MAG: RteC domain-containing protein, partial [Draconibacterium sp.]
TFGNVPLTQLSDYIQNVFNIQLDKNLSRTFDSMKIRNNPTPFLDLLKDSLLKRMGRKK